MDLSGPPQERERASQHGIIEKDLYEKCDSKNLITTKEHGPGLFFHSSYACQGLVVAVVSFSQGAALP